jgi:hypothetical protein
VLFYEFFCLYYGGRERIYVYYISGRVQQFGFFKEQNHASWVMVNPENGYMYSSNFTTDQILVYTNHYKEEMQGLTWWNLDKEPDVHSSSEGG